HGATPACGSTRPAPRWPRAGFTSRTASARSARARRAPAAAGSTTPSTWASPTAPPSNTVLFGAAPVVLPGDDRLAVGAGADERDIDLELPLDEVDVGACGVRQLLAQRLAPALERLVHGPRVVEVALVRGEIGGLGA